MVIRMEPRYRVVIDEVGRARPEYWPGCHFSVSFHKLYGNDEGHSTCVATKGDIIRLFNKIRNNWEGLDSILDRKGDKVRVENLELVVRKGDMTKEELLGLAQRRLF